MPLYWLLCVRFPEPSQIFWVLVCRTALSPFGFVFSPHFPSPPSLFKISASSLFLRSINIIFHQRSVKITRVCVTFYFKVLKFLVLRQYSYVYLGFHEYILRLTILHVFYHMNVICYLYISNL